MAAKFATGMSEKIIIKGITEDGHKFRPSDWAERMCGALSTFGQDHRINYSPLLHPTTIDGIKCIAVDSKVENHNPEMFIYIMNFAKTNRLAITTHNQDEASTQCHY